MIDRATHIYGHEVGYNEKVYRESDHEALRARVAELEAERDEWKASATTLKNLAGLATSTLEAERDARIPVSWIRECAKKWSQKEGALGEGGTE